MKKRNLMRRFLITTLLVGGIFLTGIENNAYANMMGSGAGVTGTTSGGMLGSGTATGSPSGGAPGEAGIVETTNSENLGFEDIFEALAEIFS